jgi:flagellar assembly protein FliH
MTQLVPFEFADVEAEARDRGFAEGFAQGKTAGIEHAVRQHAGEVERLMQTLESAARELRETRDREHRDLLQDATVLAVAIARKVTKRQSAIDPAVLEANLREAINLADADGPIRVAIHPSQRKFLRAPAEVEFVDDTSLSPGGCRVETAAGRIDADIETQLDRVIAALLPEAKS